MQALLFIFISIYIYSKNILVIRYKQCNKNEINLFQVRLNQMFYPVLNNSVIAFTRCIEPV